MENYVAGGSSVGGNNNNTLEVCDIKDDTWKMKAPMNEIRGYCHVSMTYKNGEYQNIKR